MLKMVDGTGIIGVDMICPLGVSTPQPPNYDRVELEGTGMLVLPNSLDAPLERLELGGKTEQVQTSGKQMLNEELLKSLSNYTSNGSDYYYHRISGLEVGKKYTISRGDVKTGKNALLGISVNQESTNKAKFLVYDGLGTSYNNASITWEQTTGEYVDILFSVSGSVTSTTQEKLTGLWERLSYVQLEKGTTATPYEPYTGGKPSPSPEYPQEIKNAGKWNEETQKHEVGVKVVGKNLFDVKYFTKNENYQNKDGGANYWKYATFEVKPNTTYTVSKQKNTNVNGAINNGLYYGGALAFNNDVNSVKITTKDDGLLYVMFFYRNEDVNILKEMNIQVELGDTQTPYQPYKEQTLTITSDRPITKWDRLVEQGGQIGWLYNTDKYIVTGQESFETKPSYVMEETVDFAFMNNKQSGIRKAADNFCNRLTYVDSVWSKHDVGFGISGVEVHIRLPLEAIGASSSDESAVIKTKFSEYLKKKYDGGGPFVFYHKSKTTEFVPLPESEQNAIRALKTYYPTTVITADGWEVDPDIKVTYRKEI